MLRVAAIALVLSLAVRPARADLLALDFQGQAWAGSSLNGTSIGGTSFAVQAEFDPTTERTIEQGVVSYAVTSLVVTVGGTPYTVTDPGDGSVTLVDLTNQVVPGFYYPLLDNNSGTTLLDEIGPAYTTTMPALSVADPTQTVFSGDSGSQSFRNVLEFPAAAGPLIISDDLIGATTLAQLDFRVDGREFAAGVVDLHLPVHTALGAVDVR